MQLENALDNLAGAIQACSGRAAAIATIAEHLESSKEGDRYADEDDVVLRAFCIDLAVSMGHDSPQWAAEAAEEIRNYIRFGVPYKAHWIEEKDK